MVTFSATVLPVRGDLGNRIGDDELRNECNEFLSDDEISQFVNDVVGVPLLVEHNDNDVVGAVMASKRGVGGSVLIDCSIDVATPRGRDVADEVRNGALTGVSAGHRFRVSSLPDGTRRVDKEILEVSVCKDPARTGARIHEILEDEVRASNTSKVYKRHQMFTGVINAAKMSEPVSDPPSEPVAPSDPEPVSEPEPAPEEPAPEGGVSSPQKDEAAARELELKNMETLMNAAQEMKKKLDEMQKKNDSLEKAQAQMKQERSAHLAEQTKVMRNRLEETCKNLLSGADANVLCGVTNASGTEEHTILKERCEAMEKLNNEREMMMSENARLKNKLSALGPNTSFVESGTVHAGMKRPADPEVVVNKKQKTDGIPELSQRVISGEISVNEWHRLAKQGATGMVQASTTAVEPSYSKWMASRTSSASVNDMPGLPYGSMKEFAPSVFDNLISCSREMNSSVPKGLLNAIGDDHVRRTQIWQQQRAGQMPTADFGRSSYRDPQTRF